MCKHNFINDSGFRIPMVNYSPLLNFERCFASHSGVSRQNS
ncbi:hypothetical protein HMPREF9554_00629 [Treponema phagedenis F0421]|nr:hypothetical protein HMPREF9554_00629 [Treponema phagedenis F0421]